MGKEKNCYLVSRVFAFILIEVQTDSSSREWEMVEMTAWVLDLSGYEVQEDV